MIEITRVINKDGVLVPIDFHILKDGRKVYVGSTGFDDDFYVTDVETKEQFWVTEDDFNTGL